MLGASLFYNLSLSKMTMQWCRHCHYKMATATAKLQCTSPRKTKHEHTNIILCKLFSCHLKLQHFPFSKSMLATCCTHTLFGACREDTNYFGRYLRILLDENNPHFLVKSFCGELDATFKHGHNKTRLVCLEMWQNWLVLFTQRIYFTHTKKNTIVSLQHQTSVWRTHGPKTTVDNGNRALGIGFQLRPISIQSFKNTISRYFWSLKFLSWLKTRMQFSLQSEVLACIWASLLAIVLWCFAYKWSFSNWNFFCLQEEKTFWQTPWRIVNNEAWM